MAMFDHTHLKIIESTFNFLEFVPTCKKSVISSVHSSDTVSFRDPLPGWPHPFLTMPTQKISNCISICMNLYQHAKNQLIPSVHSSDTVNFIVQRPDWQHPFLTMRNQKIFNQLLIFENSHQHVKNETVSSVCS